MSGYSLAWVIVIVGGLGGAAALYGLLKDGHYLVRWQAIALSLIFFLVPAPVPDHGDQLAPAFVVFVFEWLFQTDGSAGQAMRILLISLATGALITCVAYYANRRRENRS